MLRGRVLGLKRLTAKRYFKNKEEMEEGMTRQVVKGVAGKYEI